MWFIGGILLLWFAIASAGFRRLLAVLAGVAVLVAILLFAWLEAERQQAAKEEQAAKLRIPHENVELIDLRMGTDSSFVKLTGRVRNNDRRFTLTRMELRLRVEECAALDAQAKAEAPGWSAACDTVGDTTENIFVTVPPQQAREIDDYVSFTAMGSPRMKRTWRYEVVSVSGE